MPWTYIINDLNSGQIVETFYKKELQKPNRKIYYMLNGRDTIIRLIAGQIKKTQYK